VYLCASGLVQLAQDTVIYSTERSRSYDDNEAGGGRFAFHAWDGILRCCQYDATTGKVTIMAKSPGPIGGHFIKLRLSLDGTLLAVLHEATVTFYDFSTLAVVHEALGCGALRRPVALMLRPGSQSPLLLGNGDRGIEAVTEGVACSRCITEKYSLCDVWVEHATSQPQLIVTHPLFRGKVSAMALAPLDLSSAGGEVPYADPGPSMVLNLKAFGVVVSVDHDSGLCAVAGARVRRCSFGIFAPRSVSVKWRS